MANNIYDLVEQTSTTTGTAGYVMSGSVDGRRAFSNVANGDVVPYGAVDDSGGFEFGFGTWNSGTSTLARTLVLTSSNAGAAVNWAAGTRRVYITTHAQANSLMALRHRAGGSAPGASDDAASGFSQNSIVVAGGRIYVCSTPSAGAAVWASPPLVTDGSMEAGVLESSKQNGKAAKLIMGDTSGLGRRPSDISEAAYIHTDRGGWISMFRALWTSSTFDATVTMLGDLNVLDEYHGINEGGDVCIDLVARICASKNDGITADCKVWEVPLTILFIADSPTIVGGTPTVVHATAGAATWSVATVDFSSSTAAIPEGSGLSAVGIGFEVTGEAGKDIIWTAVLDGTATFF